VSALALGATACLLPQSDECRDYVACQELADTSVPVGVYREDGTCWTAPQTATECTRQCVAALASLKEALKDTPDVPEPCR